MANRLADETSPYLLQHAENPVDWYAWGEEALARARDEDKPLIVSIGYSACHWCHVMERESFENPDIAALMNEHFVCVKVDREERPDVDAIYMDAVQAMTGHGGWPLNAFLTPERRAVLRRHLLPARAAPGHAELAAGADGRRDRRGASSATEIDAPVRVDPAAPARRRVAPGARGRARHRRARRGASRRCAAATTPSAAASRAARRSSPPRRRSSSCWGAESGRWPLHTLRAMASRRHVRPGRRRLRALLGRRALGRPALREDALRQRAARAGVPARLPGVGRGLLPARVRGDARLHAARAAPGGGRLRLGAGRRLRGCRGQVLRVDAGRGARRVGGVGRRRDRALRDDRGRQLRGREHPRARHARPRGAAGDQAQALRRARAARAPGARRQAPVLVERAGDLGVRRRRRGAGRPAPTSMPRWSAPSSCCATCATRTAICCAPTTAAGRRSAPTWKTTRSCSRRC